MNIDEQIKFIESDIYWYRHKNTVTDDKWKEELRISEAILSTLKHHKTICEKIEKAYEELKSGEL